MGAAELKDPCPTCLMAGNKNVLQTNPGKFGHFCKAGHIFNDSEELHNAMATARSHFSSSFPDKAKTQAPPRVAEFFVDEETKILMEKLLGVPINGPSELKGAIYSLKNDLENAQEAARAAQSKPALVPGGARQALHFGADSFLVSIPEGYIGSIQSQAEHESKPMPVFVQEYFDTFVESYFTQNLSAAAR